MKAVIAKYAPIVTDYEILTWEIQPASSRFKAKISFNDGSCLLVKDYLFLKNGKSRKYAYHWQDQNGVLKIRWDNAFHWKAIVTFPHHKHEADHVLASREVSLDDVLQYIYAQLSVQAKD